MPSLRGLPLWMCSGMKSKVIEAITKYSLLEKAKCVTVALSGGADSMALLNVLYEMKDELKIDLRAAHFNHKIRGSEADHDEQFVREYCKSLGVKLFVSSADVLSYAKENHESTELAARKLRYEFLESVADGGVVATAHTASDCLETVLFNLSRGTALKGLCGIPAKRGIFIRPLILCTRSDIEKYCGDKKIPFVTDSTNLCDDYTRNKIRHNIIPVLKDINPSVENGVMRTACSIAEDCSFIDEFADREYKSRIKNDGLSVENLSDIHISVAKRVIMRYYELVCGDKADNFHINGIYDICLTGGRFSIPKCMSAVCENSILKFCKVNEEKLKKTNFKVEISKSVNDLFQNGQKVNKLFLKNTLDCDKIVGKLDVRTRLSFDSVKLKNRNGTKTLKKLYTEYKIPLCERDNLPVIADEKGVVWIYKIGVAERCAVDENTKNIFKITTETV